MKCLEKDRARRYETANGLARDIERHLNNETVLARPPSKLYAFQKTLRRHKFGFAAAAAIMLLLSAGVAVSTWQAVRATSAEREQGALRISAQRAEANESRQKVAAQQFLYKSLLGEARATRLARRVGYRQRVIALLEQAKALDVPEKNLADLRQAAVACLGDFVGLTPVTFTNFSTNIESVCLATSGPGGIHLLNGLYDAKLDGAPVLAITGLQFHDLIGTHTQQDVALDRLFMDVSVFNERIMGAAHAQNITELACRTALARRGVAHIQHA